MTTLSALIVPAATQWSWDRYGPILLESIGQTSRWCC